MTHSKFTLHKLLEQLTAAGHTITDSGEDVAFDHGQACAVLGVPHEPRFFVKVEATADLLTLTTGLMELVWATFERGQMEFRGRAPEGGLSQVSIVRKFD